ncbi:hypothetical protein [Clostridiisalibacter paucivorans]|uniref:hypothetical protein n=1 Tax=Clostridiisalibacter paucivorans TaxID=408753 RepID=UPI0012EBEC32|nr:hypothetical protein [Clostridiisalibacter paucivorans]
MDKYDRDKKNIYTHKKDDKVDSKLKDKTAYGEWMASTFGWVSSEKQEKKAEHIEDVTE